MVLSICRTFIHIQIVKSKLNQLDSVLLIVISCIHLYRFKATFCV